MAKDFVQDILGFKAPTPEEKAQWGRLGTSVATSAKDAVRMLNPFRAPGAPPQPAPTTAVPQTPEAVQPASRDAATPGLRQATLQPAVQEQQTRFGLTQLGNTYTQGTEGQEGFGRMVVTRQPKLGLDTTGTFNNGAFSFRGRAEDAAKFFAPVGSGPQAQRQPVQLVQNDQPADELGMLRPLLEIAAVRASKQQGGPIDFSNLSRQERRFALRNAQMADESRRTDVANLSALSGVIGSLRRGTPQSKQETESQVGLRTAQAAEANARARLITEQATQAAEQQKWLTTYEEIPQEDEYGNITKIRKPILYNPATKETIRPGGEDLAAAAAAQARRASFAAMYAKSPEQQKKWSALTPEQQDAIIAQEQQAASK